MDWKQIDKSVREDGTTITYKAEGTSFLIQSQKRHIPHASRPGTWDHTTFVVLDKGFRVREFQTMKDAKEYVEGLKPYIKSGLYCSEEEMEQKVRKMEEKLNG